MRRLPLPLALTLALGLAAPALAQDQAPPPPTPPPTPARPQIPGLPPGLALPGLPPGADIGELMQRIGPMIGMLMPMLSNLGGGDAASTMRVHDGALYVMRGNEIFRLDANTLEIQARVTLPPPPGGPGALPLGLFGGLDRFVTPARPTPAPPARPAPPAPRPE